MKKLSAIILVIMLCIIFVSGCTANKSVEEKDIVVFAAASMTETLTELGAIYEEVNSGINLIFNFDSSGTLKTQIEEGATCDAFISASQKPMNQLDITYDESVNEDRLDYVLTDTRFDILENKVCLVVPDNNPSDIDSFDDMVKHLNDGDILMSIGNSDVPVGDYTLSIFDYYDILVEDLDSNGLITYGSNVKEVTTQVSSGVVNCGIVYQTDAYSAGLTIVDTADAKMCGQVIYPACVIKGSQHVDESIAFLDFLMSEQASTVFEEVGFTPLF